VSERRTTSGGITSALRFSRRFLPHQRLLLLLLCCDVGQQDHETLISSPAHSHLFPPFPSSSFRSRHRPPLLPQADETSTGRLAQSRKDAEEAVDLHRRSPVPVEGACSRPSLNVFLPPNQERRRSHDHNASGHRVDAWSESTQPRPVQTTQVDFFPPTNLIRRSPTSMQRQAATAHELVCEA
jgi:hypothetical protein